MNHLIHFFKKNSLFFLPFIITALPYSIYLLHFPNSPQRDWNYFNSLSLIIQEYLWLAKVPLLDSWICGGVDILANPQNWVFSPFIFLTFFLPPYLANFISLIVCLGVGVYGMNKLQAKTEPLINRVLISALFNLSPFFFLHFIEGHIPYRTFYFLPLILYYARSIDHLSKAWWLAFLLTTMFLDGGLYPFYFSLILIVLNLDYKVFYGLLKNKALTKDWFFLILSFIVLISAKVIPVLSVHHSRVPENEVTSYSFANIIDALFNIEQSNFKLMDGLPYLGHEYGHYIGFSLFILFIIGLFQFKQNKGIVFQMFLFSWIAFGIGGVFNPWTLIKLIPFLNHIHIQSRFLILAFLMLIFMISKVQLSPKVKLFFLITAVLELSVCAFYINQQGFREPIDFTLVSIKPLGAGMARYENYIPKPAVYGSERISHACYEPAHNKIAPYLNLFFGENAEQLRANINFDKIDVVGPYPFTKDFILNFAWNGGWTCDNCNIYETPDGLVRVSPQERSSILHLNYNPNHVNFALLSFFMGPFLFIYSYRRIHK
ncbi:MAG TPA: hypothetical protein VNJ08_07905 [Bacteriovoracaceae bacterium]|nr:hypothetical protein [Bacteriovoracaceae bacterium]